MSNFGQFGNATPDTEKEKATVVTRFSGFTDNDFKDKGGLFDPIPKGRYHFVVYDCQTSFTKKDNTLMKTILMDIHQGEDRLHRSGGGLSGRGRDQQPRRERLHDPFRPDENPYI